MIEGHPIERIPTTNPSKLADKVLKESETKPELKKVEVPPLPKRKPPTITPLERFWAWLNYYAEGEIAKGTRGESVASPFAIFSVLKNWKWIAAGVMLLGLIVFILKLLKIF